MRDRTSRWAVIAGSTPIKRQHGGSVWAARAESLTVSIRKSIQAVGTAGSAPDPEAPPGPILSGMHISEPNRNSELGLALRERRVVGVNTQSTGVFRDRSREPDILVAPPVGSPVVIECKYAGQDARLLTDARKRLGLRLAPSLGGATIERALMVVYSSDLQWAGSVVNSELRYALLAGKTPQEYSRFPRDGWLEGSVGDLAEFVELVSTTMSGAAAGRVVNAVDETAGVLNRRASRDPQMRKGLSDLLHQEPGNQANGMAATIVVNACLFHNLAAGVAGAPRLAQLRRGGIYPQGLVIDAWDTILDHNYLPIFWIAKRIVALLETSLAQDLIAAAANACEELAGQSMVTVGDLTGQVFGKLIVDRKYLAANYTLPESAALLAGLAVSRMDVAWGDPEVVGRLRIGDLACGTGALLSAAYSQARSRMRRAGLNDRGMHKQIMERSLVGADVLPAAAHLTLMLLAAAHPSVAFDDTRIGQLKLGEHADTGEPLLGSLDLLDSDSTPSLWGAGRVAVGGRAEQTDAAGRQPVLTVEDRELDLAIMNPPYIRNTKNQGGVAGVFLAAFAAFGIPEDVRKKMGEKLSRLRKQAGSVGHGHAGLGSDFVGLAYQKTRPDGTIALVLPDTFTVSNAWKKARDLLLGSCADPIVIAHTSDTRSFSADTGMAEVLVIARKAPGNGTATWVTLNRRPSSAVEATEVARSVGQANESYGTIRVGNDDIGVYVRSKHAAITSNLDLAIAATSLANGQPTLPRGLLQLDIPMCQLGELGERGPDSSAIGYSIMKGIPSKAHTRRGRYAGPFQITNPRGRPTYPTLWHHSEGRTMMVTPDSEARPHPGEEQRASDVWARSAGRLHYSLEFRFTSRSLSACYTEPCIGGRAWPVFFPEQETWEKALCLWANTTFGLISYWWIGGLQHAGRAQMSIERIHEIPTIDCRRLTSRQLSRLDEVFDHFKDRELLPAYQAWKDDTRKALDESVMTALDLQLPDIAGAVGILRDQWSREPTVTGHKGQ